MTPQISDEQRQALQKSQNAGPVVVVDPGDEREILPCQRRPV